MTWRTLTTQQRIDAVKAVYQPGMSAAEIAVALPWPVSRNSVIGLIRRHGSRMAVQLRAPSPKFTRKGGRPRKPKEPSPPKPRKPKISARTGVSTVVRIRKPPMTPAKLPERELDLPKPEPRSLTLMELGPRSCRWCVNDPEPGAAGHLFCGETTDLGKSYCGYHAALSVGEGTRSEQDAERALRRAA